MLSWSADKNLADHFSLFEILLICILGGPLYGFIFLHAFSYTISTLGLLFGGKGQKPQVQSAIAWASIPFIWSLVFWIPAVIIWGEKCFSRQYVVNTDNALLVVPALLFAGLAIYYLIKCIYVFIQSIAEAHAFSTIKSVVTILVSLCLITLAAILIMIPFALYLGTYLNLF